MLEFQKALASIADSIRTLNETEAPLTLDEMGAIMEEAEKEAIATEEYINSYNNNQNVTEPQLANELVTGESSIFSNTELEEVFPYTFLYQDHIKKVAFQNCLSLHSSAFYNTKITEGSFPECRYIGEKAFYEATSLTSINAEKCIDIGNSAFYGCSSLSLVNFPICREIGIAAFDECSNIQEIILPECKVIGSYAFENCGSISEVILPKCSSIGDRAFINVQRLILPCMPVVFGVFQNYGVSYYSFPIAKSVSYNAFKGNSAIRGIYLPECTYIDDGAFCDCTYLSEITLTNCQIISSYVFSDCYALSSINLPKCTTIGSYAFTYCTALKSISLPECTSINRNAFSKCVSLQSINLPKCTTIGSYAFYQCYSLQSVNLPNCTSISSSAFYQCEALSEIYLTSNSVCTLKNSSVFIGTPFNGYSSVFSGTPHIYVPSSLVTEYQNAGYWQYFSSYFVGI